MKSNPMNTQDTDEGVIEHAAPMGALRARVSAANSRRNDEGAYHTATVRIYGDPSPYEATVLAPSRGDVNVPTEGDDVAVIFGPSEKPYIIGYWYPANKVADGSVDLPNYEPGERVIGTPHNSSYIKFNKSGRIELVTDGDQPVDVDHQSAAAYLQGTQDITAAGSPEIVQVDTENHDPEGLFDPSTHEITLKHDGLYTVKGTVEIVASGQNNLFTLYIYRNGSAIKHKTRQSSVNEPLSLDVDTDRKFNANDTLTLRLDHNGGTRTVDGIDGDDVATEFSIKRAGI